MPLLRLVLLFVIFLPVAAASAHGGRIAAGPASGIPIPGLTHGGMAVLTAYRGEIMQAADLVKRTDPHFRRLQNYAAIQYAYCLWGVAPGTIMDEESPFNECAHAYLAATKALLLHMRTMPGADPSVADLVSEIDARMVETGASFINCQYSGESFNTAEFIMPRWENVPTHMPTVAALGGILLIVVTPVFGLYPSARPAEPDDVRSNRPEV